MNPRTEDTLAALGAPDATTGHHSASDLPSGCCAMDKGADASQESAAKDATTYANDDRRVPQTSAPANSDHHIVRILRSSRCALKPGEIGEAMLEAGTSPPSRARLARVLRRLVASATIARARHGRGYRYFLPKQYDPRSDVFEQVLYPRECAVDEARVRALLTGRKLRWWPLGSPTLIHALARRHVGLWRLDFATGGSWWQQLTGTRQSRQLFVETASGALAVSSGKYIGFVTGDEIHRASLDEEPFVEAEWELRFPGDLGAAATNLTSLSEGREKALVSARALGIDNVSVTLAWVPCWFASVEQNSTRRELVIEAIGGRELRLPNSAIPAIRRRGGLRRERVRRVTASR